MWVWTGRTLTLVGVAATIGAGLAMRSWWVLLPGAAALAAWLLIDLSRREEAGQALQPGMPVGARAPASRRQPPTDPAAPARWQIPPHVDAVQAVAIHPSGRVVAVGGGNTVVLWQAADPAHPTRIGVLAWGKSVTVVSVAFAVDGRLLAAGCDDRSVSVFDVTRLAAPGRVGVLPAPVGDRQVPACAVAFAPDGRHLAVADRAAVVWDVTAPAWPRPVVTLPLARRWRRGVRCATTFTADGRLLALASRTTVVLWDMADPIHPTRLGCLRPYGFSLGINAVSVHAVAFSADGAILATASSQHIESYDGFSMTVSDTSAVDLWDVADPTRPRRLARLDQRGAASLRSSRHRRYPTFTGHADAAQAVAFSPAGRALLTAGADGAAILWDLTTPTRPSVTDLFPHDSPVDAVAFSPDGQLMATGCRDRGTTLWYTRQHQQETTDTVQPVDG
ncbi:MAG: hypothetical protein HKP61_04205 [Dactylosporangium sp.]|nr:hypothetical protein [Dactylosporangium sp.]NNJ60155.1 hypothetical protein [Dactylosporangium sp.]